MAAFNLQGKRHLGGYKKEIRRIHKKQDLEELAYTSGRVEDRGTGGTWLEDGYPGETIYSGLRAHL
jgi:hypothetical protein